MPLAQVRLAHRREERCVRHKAAPQTRAPDAQRTDHVAAREEAVHRTRVRNARVRQLLADVVRHAPLCPRQLRRAGRRRLVQLQQRQHAPRRDAPVACGRTQHEHPVGEAHAAHCRHLRRAVVGVRGVHRVEQRPCRAHVAVVRRVCQRTEERVGGLRVGVQLCIVCARARRVAPQRRYTHAERTQAARQLGRRLGEQGIDDVRVDDPVGGAAAAVPARARLRHAHRLPCDPRGGRGDVGVRKVDQREERLACAHVVFGSEEERRGMLHERVCALRLRLAACGPSVCRAEGELRRGPRRVPSTATERRVEDARRDARGVVGGVGCAEPRGDTHGARGVGDAVGARQRALQDERRRVVEGVEE